MKELFKKTFALLMVLIWITGFSFPVAANTQLLGVDNVEKVFNAEASCCCGDASMCACETESCKTEKQHRCNNGCCYGSLNFSSLTACLSTGSGLIISTIFENLDFLADNAPALPPVKSIDHPPSIS